MVSRRPPLSRRDVSPRPGGRPPAHVVARRHPAGELRRSRRAAIRPAGGKGLRTDRHHGDVPMRAAALVALALAAGCAHRRTLPYYADRTLTPEWLAPSTAADTVHRVGDFRLTDQRGRVVDRATVAGKIYVASFFYAECQQ